MRFFVVILQKAITKKKMLLYCSAPVKASFPMDLCLRPYTWSLLHSNFSFFLVFPSVWHFLHKSLAALLARGIVCCGSSSPTPALPDGVTCMLCWKPWQTKDPWSLPWLFLVLRSLLLEASLYSAIGFSKTPVGLNYLWISCLCQTLFAGGNSFKS